MKITALVENTAAFPGCEAAHGLSLWIETKHRRLLMDAGPSEVLVSNAQALGIDLSQAEMLVLSHGHYDHADGIPAFAAINPGAPIYLRRNAEKAYFSGKPGEEGFHYIGISPAVRSLPQLCRVDGEQEIAPGMLLFGSIAGRRCWPESNLRLYREAENGYVQDSFDHEQCLVIRENGKTALLSGCAHNGILNILDRYRELLGGTPDAVISGFHMKKTAPYTEEEEATIRATARELQSWPCRFYTCHCTGLAAFDMMKEIMGDQLSYLACGDTLCL